MSNRQNLSGHSKLCGIGSLGGAFRGSRARFDNDVAGFGPVSDVMITGDNARPPLPLTAVHK